MRVCVCMCMCVYFSMPLIFLGRHFCVAQNVRLIRILVQNRPYAYFSTFPDYSKEVLSGYQSRSIALSISFKGQMSRDLLFSSGSRT